MSHLGASKAFLIVVVLSSAWFIPSIVAQSATITSQPASATSFGFLDHLQCWDEGNTCITKSSIMASCSTRYPGNSDIDNRYGCLCTADYSSANQACVILLAQRGVGIDWVLCRCQDCEEKFGYSSTTFGYIMPDYVTACPSILSVLGWSAASAGASATITAAASATATASSRVSNSMGRNQSSSAGLGFESAFPGGTVTSSHSGQRTSSSAVATASTGSAAGSVGRSRAGEQILKFSVLSGMVLMVLLR
jgi:hypothetical protein